MNVYMGTVQYKELNEILLYEGFKPECDGWYNKGDCFYHVENKHGKFYVKKFAGDPRDEMAKALAMPLIKL